MYNVYGYSANNNGTTDVLDGGGALALNPEGVYNLAKWLFDGCSGYAARLKYMDHDGSFTGIDYNVFWPGIAYLEEAILLLEQVQQLYKGKIRLRIWGLDIQ